MKIINEFLGFNRPQTVITHPYFGEVKENRIGNSVPYESKISHRSGVNNEILISIDTYASIESENLKVLLDIYAKNSKKILQQLPVFHKRLNTVYNFNSSTLRRECDMRGIILTPKIIQQFPVYMLMFNDDGQVGIAFHPLQYFNKLGKKYITMVKICNKQGIFDINRKEGDYDQVVLDDIPEFSNEML